MNPNIIISLFTNDAVRYLYTKYKLNSRLGYFILRIAWITGVTKADSIPVARYSQILITKRRELGANYRLKTKGFATGYAKTLISRGYLKMETENKISMYSLTDKAKGYIKEINDIVCECATTWEKNFEDYAN